MIPPFVLMTGNPVEGFRIIGSFSQEHHAIDWATEWLPDLDWWVTVIVNIEDIQNERNKN
jgi:hypothetical protein